MANEVRPIDANALLEDTAFFDCYECGDECEFGYIDVDVIKNAPTIDLESLRPKGKWRLNKDGSGTCSECRRTRSDVWDMDNWDNFCSHCGADMRER